MASTLQVRDYCMQMVCSRQLVSSVEVSSLQHRAACRHAALQVVDNTHAVPTTAASIAAVDA